MESVTAGVAVDVMVTELFGEALLEKTWSVMADTTSLNTGNRSGINTRLQRHIQSNFGYGIHVLECLFHTTEILLSRVIKHVEGPYFSPDKMQADSAYNMIKKIGNRI